RGDHRLGHAQRPHQPLGQDPRPRRAARRLRRSATAVGALEPHPHRAGRAGAHRQRQRGGGAAVTAVDTPTTTEEAPPMSTTTTAPPEAPRLPPPVQMLGVFHGMRIGQAVYALAALGVAAVVAERPCTVPEVAQRVGADADALARVLRAAAAAGVFALQPDGTVALTPLARLLVRDADDSLR